VVSSALFFHEEAKEDVSKVKSLTFHSVSAGGDDFAFVAQGNALDLKDDGLTVLGFGISFLEPELVFREPNNIAIGEVGRDVALAPLLPRLLDLVVVGNSSGMGGVENSSSLAVTVSFSFGISEMLPFFVLALLGFALTGEIVVGLGRLTVVLGGVLNGVSASSTAMVLLRLTVLVPRRDLLPITVRDDVEVLVVVDVTGSEGEDFLDKVENGDFEGLAFFSGACSFFSTGFAATGLGGGGGDACLGASSATCMESSPSFASYWGMLKFSVRLCPWLSWESQS